MSSVKITFDKALTAKIVKLLGYKIDGKGYVMKDGKRVLAIDGREVKVKEIGGFTKYGIVKSDIFSLLTLADMIENDTNKEKK